MRRLTLIVVAVCFAFSLLAATLADNKGEGVRASYYKTTDLPNGIVLRSFLRILMDDGGPELNSLVATALDLPLNDSTGARSLERLEFFREMYRSLLDETDKAVFQMLCSSNRGARTKEQTYGALNQVDDMRELIAEKYYLLTINALPHPERQAFVSFLNERKTSIDYAKVDSRVGREEWEDVRLDVDQQCNSLAATRNVR